MKSPSIYSHSSGLSAFSLREKAENRAFTMIEVLVVVGILTIIIGSGLVFSFDNYRGYLFRSEYTSVINMIAKARNRAVNNFNERPHTFEILADEYRIYPSGTTDYESFPRNSSLSITPDTGTYTFEQLSGNSTTCDPGPCTITFGNGLVTKNIVINAQGGIITN